MYKNFLTIIQNDSNTVVPKQAHANSVLTLWWHVSGNQYCLIGLCGRLCERQTVNRRHVTFALQRSCKKTQKKNIKFRTEAIKRFSVSKNQKEKGLAKK